MSNLASLSLTFFTVKNPYFLRPLGRSKETEDIEATPWGDADKLSNLMFNVPSTGPSLEDPLSEPEGLLWGVTVICSSWGSPLLQRPTGRLDQRTSHTTVSNPQSHCQMRTLRLTAGRDLPKVSVSWWQSQDWVVTQFRACVVRGLGSLRRA